MLTHGNDLGNNRVSSPINSKDLGELLEVVSRRFSYREDGVAQPAHAEVIELVIEELNAKLTGQERNVLDDGQTDAPLLVFRELYYSRE